MGITNYIIKHKKPIAVIGVSLLLVIILYSKRKSIVNYILSAQNQPYVNQLNKDAKPHFIKLIKEIEQSGWNVYITSAHRPTTDKSFHQLGLVLDINLINAETKDWVNMSNTVKEWQDTGVPAIAKRLGFMWGGTGLPNYRGGKGDPVHFEYNFGKGYTELSEIAKKQYGGDLMKAVKDAQNIKFA